jgi:hypothetical protein
VPRHRVRIAHAGAREAPVALAAVRGFQADVAALRPAPPPQDDEDAVCATAVEMGADKQEVLR